MSASLIYTGRGLMQHRKVAVPKSKVRKFLQRVRKSFEVEIGPGVTRTVGKVPGVWVAELVTREKCVVLCELCERKFGHRQNHYQKDTWFPRQVDAYCDGCREHGIRNTMFHAEATIDERGNFRVLPG